MKITKLPSFPPNSNPFYNDAYHVGTTIGTNLMAMMENHPDKRCKYVILVNTETGERIRVDVEE